MKHFLLFINILICLISYSQSDIQGKFCKSYNIGYSSTCIEFLENSTFLYTTHGCLGLEDKGKGSYVLKKDQIILNFDQRQTKQRSKIRIEEFIEKEKADSIQLKFKIVDGLNEDLPLPAMILSEADSYNYDKGYMVNDKGYATMMKSRNSNEHNYRILFIGYEQFEFKLSHTSSLYIHITLLPSGPNIISDQQMVIKVKSYDKDLIRLTGGGSFKKSPH